MSETKMPDIKPGQVMICHRPCGSCPFGGGPKAIKGLRPGRIREIANAPRFDCHTAIYDKKQQVVCRGWDEKFHPGFTRVMERLGGLVEVNVYELPVGDYQPNEDD